MARRSSFTPSRHYFSSQAAPLTPQEQRRAPRFAVELQGKQLQFLTGDGTFSKRALDQGSQLLLETMTKYGHFPDTARVGDLGCGWGAVGAMWAAFHPRHTVFAVDINPRAASLAGENFRRNRLENALAWCGDGWSALRPGILDAVAFNPPIRAGNAVIERLFADAHFTLKAQGEMWAVVRTAQGAKSWAKKLELLFGHTETVEMRGGYRILKAVKV